MKRILLLLFICTGVVLCLVAQESAVPLVEEGKVWHVISLHPTDVKDPSPENGCYIDQNGRWCVGFPYEYTLKGDTVMNGQTYKKLIKAGIEASSFNCGLRQEGNRVYRCDEIVSPEYVVFDFDLRLGDIFTDYDGLHKMRVERVETIMVNGVDRRKLTMREYSDDYEVINGMIDIWIEGIGCLNGPSYPFWWAVTSNSSLLLDCYQDALKLISYEDITSNIFPKIYSSSECSGKRYNCYDLHGRRLTSEPTKGMYIKDGRKMMK